MSNYSFMESKREPWKGYVAIAVVLLIMFLLVRSCAGNRVTYQDAKQQTEQITKVSVERFIRKSNSTIAGDPWDVIFQFELDDGRIVTTRCRSGTFSAPVCAVDEAGSPP